MEWSRFVISASVAVMLGASSVGASAPVSSGTPNGKPQTLTPHRPTMAPPVSRLPEAAVMTGTAKSYGGTPIDVLTFHYDNNRTGWNSNETDLTPTTVASAKFGVLKKLTVDGSVLAQPLTVSNFVMPDGSKHNLLIVVTGLDSVYAFDADTYATLWHVNLGPAQLSKDVGCSDVPNNFGISSTPVIVRSGSSSATIFLVAATEPSAYEFHHFVHALNLGTGADTVAPVDISASATLSDGSTISFDPQNEWNRPALAYNNGSLYVGIGSHCDGEGAASTISGWLLRYNATLAQLNSFHTIGARPPPNGKNPSIELASIWMSNFAPAIDHNGNVYVITGNGSYSASDLNFGESLVKLSPTVADPPVGSFVAPNYATLNSGDDDFGSGGVILLPAIKGQAAPARAVTMGKDPIIYLVKQSLGAAPVVASYRLGPTGQNGVWGGPAYYQSASGAEIFYQINDDVLRAFNITPTSPYITAGPTGTTTGGYGGSSPVVSSNGTVSGTGVVWVVRRSSPIELEAYNANSLGAPIYSASTSSHKGFDTPLVANGRVYVGGEKVVTVFGLTQ